MKCNGSILGVMACMTSILLADARRRTDANPYGWEIDHIVRLKDGGPDTLGNLRPLQWRANAA